MIDEKQQALREKRLAKLKAVEDEVTHHLRAPWTNPLFDFVLFKQMYHGEGVRIATLDAMIEAQLKKEVVS